MFSRQLSGYLGCYLQLKGDMMFSIKCSFLSTKVLGLLIVSLLSAVNLYAFDKSEEDYELKLLGKYVFFDEISEPERMACVTCHDPSTGWTGSVSGVNLHQVAITGANPHTVGNLKPPSSAYASFSMPFGPCNSGGLRINGDRYCGGNFWDGRSVGVEKDKDDPDVRFIGATKHIGEEIFYKSDKSPVANYGMVVEYSKYFGPTSDQALNPMPNLVEQNIDRRSVCLHVQNSDYAPLYKTVWGEDINCSENTVGISASDIDGDETNFDISFKRIILAVGAYEQSSDMNSFSSKRDKALYAEIACLNKEGNYTEYYDAKVCDQKNPEDYGKFPLLGLTDQENLGHDLFYAEARCSACHSDNRGDDGTEPLQRYSRNDFHHLGVPYNAEVPNGSSSTGVSGRGIVTDGGDGFFRTPTVRNVDKRKEGKDKEFIKAYMHNGWFKSLESVVHFYNTSFLGDSGTPYEDTTAAEFGITRCEETMKAKELEDGVTEKEALANNCWPEPEFDTGVFRRNVGNLHLTSEEEAALVAYMKTLSDEYTPQAPKRYNNKK